MKTYFTKYIQVPGEIKEGSKVLHKGKILTTTNYDSWFNKWDFLEESVPPIDYDKDCKPVKLFLCSRDVQVGDKYLTAPDYTTERVCDDDSYSFEHCLKVVGEISPAALAYVKEGQEYDGDEIQKGWSNQFVKKGENSMYREFYRIKGPCGHFH